MQFLAIIAALLVAQAQAQTSTAPFADNATCTVKRLRDSTSSKPVAAACVSYQDPATGKLWDRCIPTDEIMPGRLAQGQKATDLVGKKWCPTQDYDANDKTSAATRNKALNWGVCFASTTNAVYKVDDACLEDVVETTEPPAEEATASPSAAQASTDAPSSANTLAPTDAPTPAETAAPTTAAPTEEGATLAPTEEQTAAPTAEQEEETAAPSAEQEETAAPAEEEATPVPSAATGGDATQQPSRAVFPPFTATPTAPTTSAASVASAGFAVVVTGLAALMV